MTRPKGTVACLIAVLLGACTGPKTLSYENFKQTSLSRSFECEEVRASSEAVAYKRRWTIEDYVTSMAGDFANYVLDKNDIEFEASQLELGKVSNVAFLKYGGRPYLKLMYWDLKNDAETVFHHSGIYLIVDPCTDTVLQHGLFGPL